MFLTHQRLSPLVLYQCICNLRNLHSRLPLPSSCLLCYHVMCFTSACYKPHNKMDMFLLKVVKHVKKVLKNKTHLFHFPAHSPVPQPSFLCVGPTYRSVSFSCNSKTFSVRHGEVCLINCENLCLKNVFILPSFWGDVFQVFV